MKNTVMHYCDLSEDQYMLVIIWVISFLTQVLALYLLHPKKFKIDLFIMGLVLTIFYSITYYKLFAA
jgi:hypothetical protein